MADLNTYNLTTHIDNTEKKWLKDKIDHVLKVVNKNSLAHKDMVLGVLTSGGDASGMSTLVTAITDRKESTLASVRFFKVIVNV